MISTHFDFDRIAEWGETDQLHRCADEQAHFEQATATLRWHFDFGDFSSAADG
jgi:hypothetical protein